MTLSVSAGFTKEAENLAIIFRSGKLTTSCKIIDRL